METLQGYRDFSPHWGFVQILGEGAFGEVVLLKHRTEKETIAMKIIDKRKLTDDPNSAYKESRIHHQLQHPNIIRYYGKRTFDSEIPHFDYLFLEYASGGELFNKIEPDVGMPHPEAQRYMKQLLDGVQYLHRKGICHRDIKPENLLLDGNDNLKISDFGLATVFRYKGKERLLSRTCGTASYTAPEVLTPPYKAEPTDIWSCGMVLVTLVSGELPWNAPKEKYEGYREWLTDEYVLASPWSKLDNVLLSLVRKILSQDPANRPTIEQIHEHRWMLTKFGLTDIEIDEGLSSKKTRITKRLFNVDQKNRALELPTVTLSQPNLTMTTRGLPRDINDLLKSSKEICFSQPTNTDSLIFHSDMQLSQTFLPKEHFGYMIKRMTRFFVTTDLKQTIDIIGSLLDNLHLCWNTDISGVFTISLTNSKKMELVFKATIIDMDGKLLVDFRRCKGCGIEFKRRFSKIKNCLANIILND